MSLNIPFIGMDAERDTAIGHTMLPDETTQADSVNLHHDMQFRVVLIANDKLAAGSDFLVRIASVDSLHCMGPHGRIELDRVAPSIPGNYQMDFLTVHGEPLDHRTLIVG